MQIPLQITMHNVRPSDALEARIRDNVGKLERFQPRITSCRVFVEEPERHKHQGREFHVRIEVRSPGGAQMISTLQRHEDVHVAVRDAFDAVRRQLEDTARRMRGEVKLHARVGHGTVARLDLREGVGFIAADDGRELYFSRDNVVQPPFDRLAAGMEVQFIEEQAAEGPQAKRVSAGKHRFGAEEAKG